MRSSTPCASLSRSASRRGRVSASCSTASVEGRAEPDDAGDVLGAGAQAALVTAAVQDGLQARAALHVQRADALGAVELVAGEAEHVDAELGDVDGQRPDRLHRVGVEQGALLVRDARELGDRLDRADHVVGEHDGGKTRVVAERLLVGVQVDDAVAVHRHEVDRPSQAVERPGGLHDGRMLDGAHDEVAGLVARRDCRRGRGCRTRCRRR